MKTLIKWIVLGAVLALLAILFLGGGGDWRRTLGIARTHASNAAHRVGVSTEALQSAGGVPASGDAIACARTCRENLSRIHSAKAAIRSKSGGIEVRDVSWDAILKEMGAGAIPRCPCGGSYRQGTMQERPTCSIGANGTTDKADDHAITN